MKPARQTSDTLRARTTIELPGDFAYDAISPNGSIVYLIETLSPTNYRVRAYDVPGRRLFSAVVVDKREANEPMQSAMIRLSRLLGRRCVVKAAASGPYGDIARLRGERLGRWLLQGFTCADAFVSLNGERAILEWQERHGGELARIALSRAEQLGGHQAWRPLLPVTQLAAIKPG